MILEAVESIASEFTQDNKLITIPADSILANVNVSSAIAHDSINGIDNRIASILNNEISFIKGDIVPLIKEYGKYVAEFLESNSTINPLAEVKIVIATVPEVIEELITRGYINLNGAKIGNIDTNTLTMPELDGPAIRQYMTLDGGQLSKIGEAFSSTVTNDELVRIYNTYLKNISNTNPNYTNLGSKVNSERHGFDLFVLSILVKNLKNNYIDGVRVSENVYTNILLNLDAVLDAKISYFINSLKAYSNVGRLVIKSTGLNDIVINGDVYDKYLDELDGDPEVIYGGIISGKHTLSLTDVTDNKKEYYDNWVRYSKSVVVKQSLGNIEKHRVAYRLAMTRLINEYMNDDIKETIGLGLLSNINNIIVAFMNDEEPMELLQINHIVEEIVTKILFSETNAHKFLSYMKHYSMMDKSITAKDAATYASVDIILDFLLTQVEIS